MDFKSFHTSNMHDLNIIPRFIQPLADFWPTGAVAEHLYYGVATPHISPKGRNYASGLLITAKNCPGKAFGTFASSFG